MKNKENLKQQARKQINNHPEIQRRGGMWGDPFKSCQEGAIYISYLINKEHFKEPPGVYHIKVFVLSEGNWYEANVINEIIKSLDENRYIDTGKQIKNTIDQIIKGYKPQKIIMFGSCAKGDRGINIGSDLDLIVIKNTNEKFLERIDKVLDCCKESIGVEPLVYTEEEIKKMLDEGNDFLETALSEGVIMYGE